MMSGWRRVFCTAIPKEKDEQDQQQQHTSWSPRIGFFSNPSPPPTLKPPPLSSPNLRCKTTASLPNSPNTTAKSTKNRSPRLFFNFSTPSSPKSPSTFSLLKTTLRLNKTNNNSSSSSPYRNNVDDGNSPKRNPSFESELPEIKTKALRCYNDDEPLMSPISLARFNPIPESDEFENGEVEENRECGGSFVNHGSVLSGKVTVSNDKNIGIEFSPETAVVTTGRRYKTYAVMMKVKAPSCTESSRRDSVDLVAVVDVSASMSGVKMDTMKRAMRLLISTLRENDRLSIVAFSSASKRLLPLRRMTPSGRRSARRIVDAICSTGKGMSVNDAIKKAVKVIEDREQKNPTASIFVISDAQSQSSSVMTTTRYSHLEIPVHSISLASEYNHAPPENLLTKCITDLLNLAFQELRLQIDVKSGSIPAEIVSVFSISGRPESFGSGTIHIGDLYGGEERVLLVELKVPAGSVRSHHIVTVRSIYKDPSTQEYIHMRDQLHTVRLTSREIERIKLLHISTQAIAESRRLLDRNDLSCAYYLLSSARAIVLQSSLESARDNLLGLEAELAEISRRRQVQELRQRSSYVVQPEEKPEPLTPTSAWRAAEKLAKVAVMKKHLNRVSDLHGFENARF